MKLILSANLLFFSGCVALAPETFPEPPGIWGIVPASGLEIDRCDQLEGKYMMLADHIEYVDGEWVARAPDYLAFYSSIIGPAEASGISITSPEKVIQNNSSDRWFQIRLNDSGELSVDYFLGDERTYSFQYDSENRRYVCERGVLNFTTEIDISGGEGVQANSQRRRSMGLNVNGDLVVYDWTSPARGMLDQPRSGFSAIKFPRKSPE